MLFDNPTSVQRDATPCNWMQRGATDFANAQNEPNPTARGARNVPKCSGMFHHSENAKRTHFATVGLHLLRAQMVTSDHMCSQSRLASQLTVPQRDRCQGGEGGHERLV